MQDATLAISPELETMMDAMAKANCPEDQAECFITAGYVPIEGMLAFHARAREADKAGGPEEIALGGKRGPGKSHTIMAQVGIDDCQRVAGLKVLFLRNIKKAAAESFEDVVRRVFSFTPHKSANDGVEFPNGSRMLIGGFKDEKDIDKYLGVEYDIIVIEECTLITETKKEKIRGSLRTSKQNWRPRMYLSTNADGVGLAWFKKQFIEPSRKRTETFTRFLDVTHIHNPFVNVEYEQYLDRLTGPLRKAWKDGDWDAFAGMAFPEWNRDIHVIQPFDIPDHWVRWRASDWGTASPFCTLWATKDPDTRRIYVYREAYQAGLTDRQQARMIVDMTPPNEKIFVHYADPNSYWVGRNKDNKVFTSADEYKAEGVILTKADNDRISGMRKVHNLLAPLADGLPGIQFFDHCEHIIEQLGNLASDKLHPEDVDTDGEDHAFDTLKYLLTNEKKAEQQNAPKPQTVNPYSRIKGI